MREIADGILQLTLPLPLGLDHVHCYLLRRPSGGWTLVDTGLGVPDWEERWATVTDELDAPIERILISHFHPDHVGGADDVRRVTGAEVLQGAADHAFMRVVWDDGLFARRTRELFEAHGTPPAESLAIQHTIERMRPAIRYVEQVTPLHPGDDVDGWEVHVFGGHADGHIALLRDGVLVAGDNLLMEITPNIGYYLDGDPDPLGTYYGTLERIRQLAPRLVLPGHEAVISDAAGRARETLAHHEERLGHAQAPLDRATPRSAYEVSQHIWPMELAPIHRRFAVQEAIAHLERLVHLGRARRHELDAGGGDIGDGSGAVPGAGCAVAYTSA